VHVNKRLFLFALATVALLGSSPPAEAQARARARRSVVVVGGAYFASPLWYGYPWGPYWSGWYGYPYWYGYPFQYPWPPYGGYYRFDSTGALRLDVTPKEAEVYVDGYYAGIVDDFDGVFQRLHVPPGERDITFYLDGYRAAHQKVYLTPRSTRKISRTLERLAPGDVAEPRPTPPPTPPRTTQPQDERDREPAGRRQPRSRGGAAPREPAVSAYGTLSIRVQPADATVLVDGERWEVQPGQDRVTVEVPEGGHRVEIQKEGYETFSRDVAVRRGVTTPLNVSLRPR
jgi:hypothetical protein